MQTLRQTRFRVYNIWDLVNHQALTHEFIWYPPSPYWEALPVV